MKKCDACSARPEKVLRCSGCLGAWYCNAKCQRADWQRHKESCKDLQREKVLKKHTEAAAEIQRSDAMRVVFRSARMFLSRCADPDGSVYSQTMPQAGFRQWVEAAHPACWCHEWGKCANTVDASFIVMAFAPSALEELPQPRSRIHAADRTRERGQLRSSSLSLFGVSLRLVAAPMMGTLDVSLEEVVRGPAAPLDAVTGISLRTGCFFLTGSDASGLALPPPMASGPNAGKQRANCAMHTWCGIGERSVLAVSEFGRVPRVPIGALLAEGGRYRAAVAPPDLLRSNEVVAVAVLIERVGSTANVEELEEAIVTARLHDMHASADAAVPAFARSVALSSLAGPSTQQAGEAGCIRVEWMQ
jgi:hypothetical protein